MTFAVCAHHTAAPFAAAIAAPPPVSGPSGWRGVSPMYILNVSCHPDRCVWLTDGSMSAVEFVDEPAVVRALQRAVASAFPGSGAAASAAPPLRGPGPSGYAASASPTVRRHIASFAAASAPSPSPKRASRRSVPQLYAAWGRAVRPTGGPVATAADPHVSPLPQQPAPPSLPQVGVAASPAIRGPSGWGRRGGARPNQTLVNVLGARTSTPLAVTKTALEGATVVAQVDRKFIIARCRTGSLLCVDQHAADERVRVESLQRQLRTAPDTVVSTHVLDHPVRVACHPSDVVAATHHHARLTAWRFRVRHNDVSLAPSMWLEAVPAVMGVPLTAPAFLDYVRALVASPAADPPAVQDVLASKACRGAIMFGDVLTLDQCAELLAALAQCRFPFQCAHGRPSLVPLVQLPAPNTTCT